MSSLLLNASDLIGSACKLARSPLFPKAIAYTASHVDDGLQYHFPAGLLADQKWLSADILLEGTHLAVFILHLQEGKDGPTFSFHFGLINQCQARIRMDLHAVKQNKWRYSREAAFLKPTCYGSVVHLEKVDRMALTIHRKSDCPVIWSVTPFKATSTRPARLKNPLILTIPLLDELGQSTIHDWPGKSKDRDAVTQHLSRQLEHAPLATWPPEFSRWGGWTKRAYKGTGFFRTHKAEDRWWLVDPDGFAFWSTGPDCVNCGIETSHGGLEKALAWLPENNSTFSSVHGKGEGLPSINFLRANLIHAFGPDQAHASWATITLSLLRQWGFNTVANWSDWRIARQAGFPYVRPMRLRFKRTPLIFRDFPDVFHPSFPEDCNAFAAQLRETRDDPALIGYFLMNEPTWGFAAQTPAEGIWWNAPESATGLALKSFLKERGVQEPAQQDFTDFSSLITEKLFRELSEACRAVDPHHLNLGARYYTTPPEWAVKAMRQFDVFSLNCYQEKVWPDKVAEISGRLDMPVLVGEWHFGALDAGLPASGIGHVANQQDRGKAYRYYLENAAALPGCVGVHYFTLYDQSALGRFDGENYNIGFLDTCNQPYEAMAEAARSSHERMYGIAAGALKPDNSPPKHLPLLFM